MNFRLRGQRGKLSAAEINRWNKLADQQARGELRRLPPVTLQTYDPNARVVRAKNESGSDRVAFDCMAIDGLLWDLEADGSADVVFSLGTADPDKAPAILLEPIADDGVGLVVIDGPAIAKIDQASSTSLRWADPQASTHSLEPAGSGSIKLLQAPSTSGSKIMPVILNAATVDQVLVKTPVGGIAGATGSGPYTFGSATCTIVSDAGVVGSATLTVRNIVSDAVAGNVVGKAARVGGIWVIDVASCE
jgi:hypothetical protein